MAAATPKIVLSRSQDIPFNQLVLSQANVRRVKAGVSIDELAEDIARRTLLHSLTVRVLRDADGNETGRFEVPTGGRRFRALELLVKQKRLAKTAPIPCIVREDGLGEEDSLAENLQRVALHPLDQFRAFQTLRDKGLGEEEIAARFFLTPAVVRQRLKLAAVSPTLLDVYAADGMTLDQLIAFSVSGDHARQEQVWAGLGQSWQREPHHIRRLLTETTVPASDRRALFVGLPAYEAAGGVVLRDLFAEDGGGWLQDIDLLERLVAEKLAQEAEAIRAEGWAWVEAAVELPYRHVAGLHRLTGTVAEPTEEDRARRDALQAEYDQLVEAHAGSDGFPDEVERRLDAIELALGAFDDPPVTYDPAEMARAGTFVSLTLDGTLRVERGYVRPEDEPPVATDPDAGEDGTITTSPDAPASAPLRGTEGAQVSEPVPAAPALEPDEDALAPLSDRLLTELTVHRTVALRDALAIHPDVALLAVLHALCLGTFYSSISAGCLEISLRSTDFTIQGPGLNDSPPARAIDARHANWARQMPAQPVELWDALVALDADSRADLLAHCASLAVNAVHEAWGRAGRSHHADRLAEVVGLDMAAAGWVPTVDNYLGRVSKARILAAVREAQGETAVDRIDHLRKRDMAVEAERLLAGTGWLPEPLRRPDHGLAPEGAPDPVSGVDLAAE